MVCGDVMCDFYVLRTIRLSTAKEFAVSKSKFFHRLVQFLLIVFRQLTALADACERLCVLPVEEIHVLFLYLGDFVYTDREEKGVARGVERGDLLLERDGLAVLLLEDFYHATP